MGAGFHVISKMKFLNESVLESALVLEEMDFSIGEIVELLI